MCLNDGIYLKHKLQFACFFFVLFIESVSAIETKIQADCLHSAIENCKSFKISLLSSYIHSMHWILTNFSTFLYTNHVVLFLKWIEFRFFFWNVADKRTCAEYWSQIDCNFSCKFQPIWTKKITQIKFIKNRKFL